MIKEKNGEPIRRATEEEKAFLIQKLDLEIEEEEKFHQKSFTTISNIFFVCAFIFFVMSVIPLLAGNFQDIVWKIIFIGIPVVIGYLFRRASVKKSWMRNVRKEIVSNNFFAMNAVLFEGETYDSHMFGIYCKKDLSSKKKIKLISDDVRRIDQYATKFMVFTQDRRKYKYHRGDRVVLVFGVLDKHNFWAYVLKKEENDD